MAESNAAASKDKPNNSGNETDASLRFSGASEDLKSTNSSNIGETVAKDFTDLEEDHVVVPVSTAQAIKTENHEHGLSDDDLSSKTLTTLETVKEQETKKSEINDDVEYEICPIEEETNEEDVEDEEETILLEVDDENATELLPVQAAELQLNSLQNKNLKSRQIKLKTTETTVFSQKVNNAVKKEKICKLKTSILKSTILTRAEIEQEVVAQLAEPLNKNRTLLNVADKITPIKPIPQQSTGTIEIPRAEILLTPETEGATSPIILNHVKHNSKKMDSNELIAILEGDDTLHLNSAGDDNHFEVSVSIVDDNMKQNPAEKVVLSKDEEREIAMQQMMALPTKKKGRPRLDPSSKMQKNTKQIKKEKKDAPNDLVKSLVSDWSDNENKTDEHTEVETEAEADTEAEAEPDTETEILIEIENAYSDAPEIKIPVQKKRKVENEILQPTFKRQRVIKKKIIWDPDAPETAINYASFAHTSGPGQQKKEMMKKLSPIKKETTKAAHDTTPSPTLKKKKTSEIDKLLGDEGAINMLNSLNQENNNNDGSSVKLSRNKTIKTEPIETITTLPTKARTPRKDQKEVQKQSANKRSTASAGGPTQPKKRNTKTPANSSSWDYVYSARPDDCMIIRRRSNSSYSSTASPNRSSIDFAQAPPIIDSGIDSTETENVSSSEPKTKKTKTNKGFEFVKPVAKRMKIERNEESESMVSGIRGNFNKFMDNEALKRIASNQGGLVNDKSFAKIKNETGQNQLESELSVDNNGVQQTYNEIKLKRHANFGQIILKPLPAGGKHKNMLTIQVSKYFLSIKTKKDETSYLNLNFQLMQEIELALNLLETDKLCKLVVISSANSSFCSGLDFTTLIQSTVDKRKSAATDLSKKLWLVPTFEFSYQTKNTTKY